ncbi:glycosyl transferase [Neptunitalea sp. Y10]|uniref:Glycosyl transferase n=1 Tax=Neptunitalea lumnitzerae TaxID=2965509 RepID=A0ABQ5MJZ3_9FLAO|nr:glycosyl transferase [Neptunitalea sp. Y10]
MGAWGVAETSEARYAEISREMLLSNNYLYPKLLGVYHFHKPPVTYYLTVLGYQIFGINEFGARFFLQLAVVIQLLLVYKIVDLLYKNRKLALYAAICYFTIPIVLMAGRNLTTDIYLTTFIIAGVFHWLSYIHHKGNYHLYLYYLFMGISFETKGPVGLLFLLSFVIIYRTVLKERFKITMHHVLGFILFIVVGGLWYFLLIYNKPEVLDYFIIKQTVSRIASKSFHRDQPFWFYLPILLGVLFPYVISFFASGKKLWKINNRVDKVLLWNTVIIIVIFSSIVTKRIFYILPAFWMIAILIVRLLSFTSDRVIKAMKIAYISLILIYAMACVVLYFYKVETITIPLTQLVLVLIALILFLIVYFKFFKSVRKPGVVYGMGLFFFSMVLVSGTFFMKNNRDALNSFKPIVAFIEQQPADSDKKIFAFDFLINSIPFYTNSEFYTVNYLHDTVVREIEFQANDKYKNHLINVYLKSEADRFKELLDSGANYVLVKKKYGVYPPFNFIKEKLPHTKDFGKWVLYYN